MTTASLVLFGMTTRGSAALGDAPETIAGVASVGVLHAPGYPSYVLAARLFSWVVAPAGSLALRVNLFSVLCAAVAVGGVFAVARRLGSSAPAAGIAAATFASGASTLYYAGYAKHYAYSGMLLVIATVLVLRWVQGGRPMELVAAGVCVGLMLGASWQLAFVSAPGLAVLVLLAGRRDLGPGAMFAAAAGGLTAVAVYSFVLVRAGQDPAMNWGDARSPSRLADLLAMRDFGLGDRIGSGVAAGTGGGGGGGSSGLLVRIVHYVRLYTIELGLLGCLVAGAGLWSLLRRSRPRLGLGWICTVVGVNTLAAAVVVSPGSVDSVRAALVLGGFLIGAFMAISVAAGFGVEVIVGFLADRVPVSWTRDVRPGAMAVAGVLLVAPTLWSHLGEVGRRQTTYAEQYATNVFSSTPDDAVVMVWDAERTFPLRERQVVHGARPDVFVIAADGLAFDWYRSQIERRLGIELPPRVGDSFRDAASAAAAIGEVRPVVLDLFAAVNLNQFLAYEVEGLVARPVDGPPGARLPDDVDEVEAELASYDLTGIYDGEFRTSWPNETVNDSYVRLHLELARIYVSEQRWEDVERHLVAAQRIDPGDDVVDQNLEALEQQRTDR